MKSKTSYFSKAVFKKDITQLWSLWAVEIFLSILVFMMPLISSINTIKRENIGNVLNIPNEVKNGIKTLSAIMTNPIFVFILAIVVAIAVFQYIFNTRDMYMIHSFPIKRESLFVSHYISGVVIMLIPYVVGFAGYIIIGAVYKTGLTLSLMLLAGEVFAMIILFYSIACVVVMVCGNSIMSIIIYAVLNVLYIALYVMLFAVNQMFSYASREILITDILQTKFIWLSPVAYVFKKVGFRDNPSSEIIYAQTTGNYMDKYQITSENEMSFVCVFVAGILIFMVALMLYKYRKSETVGDMVSFGWCKPVFRTVFSISGGLFLSLIMWSLYFYNTDFVSRSHTDYEGKRLIYVCILVLICVSVFYFISEMILKKTFFVWKNFNKANFLVAFGFMLIFLVMESVGIIGVKIPDINEISSLEISSSNEILYTDKNDISKFIKINKEIEKERIDAGEGENIAVVQFSYRLKDGSKRDFCYDLPGGKNSFSEKIVQCVNNSNQKLESVFSRAYNDPDYKLQQITISGKEYNSDEEEWYSYDIYDAEAGRKLYNAMKKDILEGNITLLDLYMESEEKHAEIYFRPYVNQTMSEKYKFSDYEKKSFFVGKNNSYGTSKVMNITKKAKNTVLALSELNKAGMLKVSEEYEQ